MKAKVGFKFEGGGPDDDCGDIEDSSENEEVKNEQIKVQFDEEKKEDKKKVQIADDDCGEIEDSEEEEKKQEDS